MKEKTLNESVSQMAKGDLRGLDALFNAYHKRIYYFALKLGLDHDSAEEIVQEVFLKLWSAKKSIDVTKSPQSYIFTVAKNVIIDEFKERARRKATEDYQIHLIGTDNGTTEEIEYQEMKSLINQATSKLPDQGRLVFELSRFKGLTNKEISIELGISIKTVESHITRALKSIREALKRAELVNVNLLLIAIYLDSLTH